MQTKTRQVILKKCLFAQNPTISWSDFVILATEVSKLYDFPPCITICQAALECGRGTSVMAKSKNNYFGFMAYDHNPGMAKKYDTALDSIIDYLDLITKNPRYSQAMKYKTPARIIKAIWEAGYATDPQYVKKIMALKEWRIKY